MKPGISFLMILLIILASCKEKQPDERKNVLSQEQLSSLLIKVYLAEAVAEGLPYARDSSIKYFVPFEQKLLKSKNIPDSVLKKTYQYYIAHPKELEKVYDIVIDSLTLKEQSFSAAAKKK
jgi:hypothetical protein